MIDTILYIIIVLFTLSIPYRIWVWRYVGSKGVYSYFQHRLTGKRTYYKRFNGYSVLDQDWLDGEKHKDDNIR